MASVNPSHSTISVESLAPPAPENKSSTRASAAKNHVVVDVVLRAMLFATAFVAITFVVTSKQTKLIPVAPGIAIPMAAKFNQYYVAALSVTCFYSVITGLLSALALVKMTEGSTKTQVHLAILDALLLGIMASATGAAGGVGYIGFKGNNHTGWTKICNVYGSFCRHIAASIAVSLLPSVALLLLVWVSVFILSKKISRS
ncbi:putative casparian strip membrane protein [Helianthus annuus]|uniref:CASP-like protein n=1 Tax=Helianthus annuus TaxID=4232 RepID=A0A251SMQ4_HELAN|nr:putative casparian strip membrane protein [Helianthus annuus]KAJ0475399.1 putative casparian strip membrane protein [Helianthus annuus]KAJ0662277.1 putative casparian strip membrane protein [Helianthus annuus]